MYFSAWILVVGLSLWASILAFVWAVHTGQFSDQKRARYLPLREERPLDGRRALPPARNAGTYALLSVLAAGVAALLAPIVLLLLHSHP
jgi:cbb3-type cytochrome oxidase maturation protein